MKNEISKILKLLEVGNTDKALQEVKVLHKLDRENLDIIKLLAYTYIQFGLFDKVILTLEEGYKDKPNAKDFDYYNNIGYSLMQIEDYEKSIDYLNNALEINDKNPGTFSTIATVYLRKRNFEKAQYFIDQSVELIFQLGEKEYTKYTSVFLLKSEINSALKKDDKTVELFINILNKKFNENIFYLLTNIRPNVVNLELIKSAEENLKINNSLVNKIERFNFVTPIYFGLANYYQLTERSKSEKFFDLGNEEIFKTSRYNSHQYQISILKSMDIFKNKFQSYNNENDKDGLGKNNIFIVGSPRSGTTLIESIVSANTKVFSGGELTSAKNLIDSFVRFPEKGISNLQENLNEKYLSRTSYLKGDFTYFIDKMPENFLFIGYLIKLLPKSKIIRVFRNPWDIAISLYKQRYILNIPYSCSFFNIGIFLANFEAVNLFWNKNLENKKNILDIKYEELVENQAQYQKKIYAFLDLDAEYNDKIREGFFSPTASIRQVKGKIHNKSVNKTDFAHKKSEFLDSLQMQRQFWKSRGITSKNGDFFGYSIDN